MMKERSKENCCGCTACASICPKEAITMRPDGLGFLYPSFDRTKCIECGLCEKICSFNNFREKDNDRAKPEAFAVRHKDINEIETSRSGAAFIALSDWILGHNGIIYGAGYQKHFKVIHKRAENKEQRDEFKGSKYVQSDLTGVFSQIKADLLDGRLVCFSGTPCQTAGLSSFIGPKLRANLYLIDIVCHGVPSPFVWEDYLTFIEKKYKSRIIEVNFRDKTDFGWSTHKESYRFDNGEKTYKMQLFTNLFFKHIMFRRSCAKCHYCNLNRPGDITIGDYWGWEKTDKYFNIDNKGCSLVLINTAKGGEWFNQIQEACNVIPARIENVLQPNLEHPSIEHHQREEFERDYIQRGLSYIMRKYGDNNIKKIAKKTIWTVKNDINKVLLMIKK